MKDVKGKTAFITGGASGIGLGIAQAFAAAGMNVVITDVEETALAEAAATVAAEPKSSTSPTARITSTRRKPPKRVSAMSTSSASMPACRGAARSKTCPMTIGTG